MQRRLHISAPGTARPSDARVFFCDAPSDGSFRPGVDVELSHWLGCRTLPPYRGDTGTESCLKYTQAEPELGGLVVNNHVSVDGILSAFVMLQPALARTHAPTLIQAARMGDFCAWAEPPAQALYQGLTLRCVELMGQGAPPQRVYEDGMEFTARMLGGLERDNPRIPPGLRALQDAERQVESGRIQRRLPTERLAHYTIPSSVVGEDVVRALHIPAFNTPLGNQSLLPPQARARWDRERVQLVSVETSRGWHHDLFYPWYCWADTPSSWRPPGIRAGASPSHCVLHHPPLIQAAEELQAEERNPVQWVVPSRLFPFQTTLKAGRRHPVVLSTVDNEGQPAASSHHPQRVVHTLSRIF